MSIKDQREYDSKCVLFMMMTKTKQTMCDFAYYFIIPKQGHTTTTTTTTTTSLFFSKVCDFQILLVYHNHSIIQYHSIPYPNPDYFDAIILFLQFLPSCVVIHYQIPSSTCHLPPYKWTSHGKLEGMYVCKNNHSMEPYIHV